MKNVNQRKLKKVCMQTFQINALKSTIENYITLERSSDQIRIILLAYYFKKYCSIHVTTNERIDSFAKKFFSTQLSYDFPLKKHENTLII